MSLSPFALYCKSYHTDVLRVVRLARSIAQFNVNQLPFFVSVPKSDLPLFKQQLDGMNIELLADEDIIATNPGLALSQVNALPGNISQQIIKSEFWRLGASQAYLCLDSDAMFIRPFQLTDFIAEGSTPYTIIDEGRDLLIASLVHGKDRVALNFQREAAEVQSAFGRSGKAYNFGPSCPVWDRRVWESLESEYMRPRQQSLFDLIVHAPHEMRWYGEALLRYKAIDLLPAQPFFKMYHYAWQLQHDKKQGVHATQLAQLYCGIIFQSAWEREMDWPKEPGGWSSKLARRLRRRLGRA